MSKMSGEEIPSNVLNENSQKPDLKLHQNPSVQTLLQNPSCSIQSDSILSLPHNRNSQAHQDPSIDTPASHFRPRKFSSPFVTFPTLHLEDAIDDVTNFSLLDSGLGSSLADHVIDRNKLCPKYHGEGLCELGPKCLLVHERKRTLFDPSAPEFHPAHKHNNHLDLWNGKNNSSPNPSISWSKDSSSWNKASNLVEASTLNDDTSYEFCGVSGSSKSRSTSLSYGSDFTESIPQSGDGILAKDLTALALKGIAADFSVDDLNWKEVPTLSNTPPEDSLFGEGRHFIDTVKLEGSRLLNPLKYKTEPCTTFFTIGACPYGEKCFFYHKVEEKSRMKSKIKTRLCKSWTTTGWCEYGQRCDFAHGCDELTIKFKTRMCKVFLTTGRCPYGAQCTFAHTEDERRKDISTVYKFKTELCRLWLNGNCSYGPVCHFAHGVHELQNIGDLPP